MTNNKELYMMVFVLLMVWLWMEKAAGLPVVDFDIWSENGNYVNSSVEVKASAGGERASRGE